VAYSQVFGAHLNTLVYLSIFGFITLFGAWVGGLVGLNKENQKISFYHNDIEAGKYLILIDIKAEQEDVVKSLMAQKHPEAQFKRTGSTFINPFKFAQVSV
jgi:hypothetical protein